jgi:hypothetical protein
VARSVVVVDAGKSMMLLLLAAVDEGARRRPPSALVGDDNRRLRELLGMPRRLEIVGVVTVGHAADPAERAARQAIALGAALARSSAGNAGRPTRRRRRSADLQPVRP